MNASLEALHNQNQQQASTLTKNNVNNNYDEVTKKVQPDPFSSTSSEMLTTSDEEVVQLHR